MYVTYNPKHDWTFLSSASEVSANALVSGSGSGIPLIKDIEPSNSRDRLSHATFRFFSLAEQCQIKKFYLRCFNSDYHAVKSKFGLLIE